MSGADQPASGQLAGACPGCGSTARAETRQRPPLALSFCAGCGVLLGVEALRDRLGATLSPLPSQVFTLRGSEPQLPLRSATPPVLASMLGGGTRPTLKAPPPRTTPSPALPAAAPEVSEPTPLPARTPPAGFPALGEEERTRTPPPTLEPGFAYPRVLLADANVEFRNVAESMLLVSGLAEELTTAKDGAQLLSDFTRACRAGTPFDLVVLDTALPLLDGRNVAILLRAVEDAFSLPPARLVFYTSKESEAALQQLLAYLKNARYLARPAEAAVEVQAQQLLQQLTAGLTPKG